MYQEHFGFQNSPFEDRLAQDAEVFIGAKQRAALANLKIALGTRDAAVVLTGAAGVGKTTLGSYSLRTTTTRLALAWIGLAPLTGHELLEHLLTEFGFSPYKCSRAERLQTWRQFLNEMSLTETRVGILIEKAESLGNEVLQTLESLTSATPSGCPGANLVLTGDPALRDVLKGPGLESLRQRVRLSQTLDALDAKELQAFLNHKLDAAAGDAQAVFAPGAVAMLHHFSEGRIRVVKNLCETALTIAAVRKEPRVTPRLIAQVAVGLFGLEPPRSAAAVTAPPQEPLASVQETASIHEPALVPQTEPVHEAESVRQTKPGSSASRLQHDDADAEPDVPTLTDSVEIAADRLLEDVAISEQVSAEVVAPAAPDDDAGSGGRVQADASPDADDDFTDDEEAFDPQQDALQAFANAKALEDISNSMAETLFGDAELEQLAATLSVANNGAGPTDGGRQPPAPQDGDEPRAVSALGGSAPRFA